MKKLILFLSVIFLLTSVCSVSAQEARDATLLVFTKTEGWRHKSIPAGVQALKELGDENGFSIDHTEDATCFNTDNLARYDAIIFLNTTGDVLNEQQQDAFEQFVSDGGGYVGIHSASDTEYDWSWYGELVGTYFDSHPKIQEATIRVVNTSHPSTEHLPNKWVRTDEWYNFKHIQDHINVLAYLDESTYEGGKNGEKHPIAWYHETKGGRAFYTAGGHTSDSYSEPLFRKHLLGGIRYVLGKK